MNIAAARMEELAARLALQVSRVRMYKQVRMAPTVNQVDALRAFCLLTYPCTVCVHARLQALVSVVEEKADLETQVVVLQEKVRRRRRRGGAADVREDQTRADMQPKAPNHVPPTPACLMTHPMFC